jgi:hypothetical protein
VVRKSSVRSCYADSATAKQECRTAGSRQSAVGRGGARPPGAQAAKTSPASPLSTPRVIHAPLAVDGQLLAGGRGGARTPGAQAVKTSPASPLSTRRLTHAQSAVGGRPSVDSHRQSEPRRPNRRSQCKNNLIPASISSSNPRQGSQRKAPSRFGANRRRGNFGKQCERIHCRGAWPQGAAAVPEGHPCRWHVRRPCPKQYQSQSGRCCGPLTSRILAFLNIPMRACRRRDFRHRNLTQSLFSIH